MWIPPIASAPRICGRQLRTSATHAGQAGALHVKAETETVVIEDEVSSKDGLRTRDGAPGYRARSITDGIDWRDPSETSGRSIAGSAAGLVFGKPGAIQGGGPGRAKRSPSSAREGPEGHDQATDCDRGCKRGRPHGATGRGTRRKRGGSRDSIKVPDDLAEFVAFSEQDGQYADERSAACCVASTCCPMLLNSKEQLN